MIELRIERQGARDADPLPLTAGKLVRVAACRFRMKPDAPHQRDDLLTPRPGVADAVDDQRFLDVASDDDAGLHELALAQRQQLPPHQPGDSGLIHGTGLHPYHRQGPPRRPVDLLPMSPVYSVTHVADLDHPHPLSHGERERTEFAVLFLD